MRIGLRSDLASGESIASSSSAARPAQTAGKDDYGDAAQLSSSSLAATTLAAAASQVPEIRQEKVAALAEQLRAGTYEVSPEQTAEAMLSEMRAA
jgi:negative regulator of flagellin synthesis FlgM